MNTIVMEGGPLHPIVGRTLGIYRIMVYDDGQPLPTFLVAPLEAKGLYTQFRGAHYIPIHNI